MSAVNELDLGAVGDAELGVEAANLRILEGDILIETDAIAVICSVTVCSTWRRGFISMK